MEVAHLVETVVILAEAVTVMMARETVEMETGTEDVDDSLIDGLVGQEAAATRVMDQVAPRS